MGVRYYLIPGVKRDSVRDEKGYHAWSMTTAPLHPLPSPPGPRQVPEPSSWGRVRRFLHWYLVAVMAGCQAAFLLTLTGGGEGVPPILAMGTLVGVLPILAAALIARFEDRRHAEVVPPEWRRWLVGALAMLGVWAGSYFAVGHLTTAERVVFLSSALDTSVPFDSRFVFLYVLLYPIFLLPFFVVRDQAAFRRLVAAYLIMIGVCSAVFLAYPVAFDRPPLPARPWPLSVWTLSLIHGSDPAWNCLPSEHCAAALIATFFCWEADRKVGLFALIATLAIGVSTLLTKQHYLVDVITGYALAAAAWFATRWLMSPRSVSPAPR